ncbi:hypothetical protein [Mycolicibacterium sp. 050158]|uniref:DUF7159 family protein n=1 Tax=Mycolicibacterium sp. 050158 TaxID=3090602 RepID=UPI00299EEFA3|nr:hypothetical protein [Mycolicibacterium sp. 050158]MDX1888104.1 hypothetical protein [Mycolicibacterium sp. 050158]
MDLVLGLSLTSVAVRWVLVEGTTGAGDPVDRGEVDIPALDALDADLLVHAVLNPDVIDEQRIRVIGVTSTRDAEAVAGDVVAALAARGHRSVVSVSDDAAVAALAGGIVDITEYDDVAVCIVEPDSAFVALVSGGEVVVERIDRPADGADALELTSSVIVVLDGRRTDAIFVIGSEDGGVIVSAFEALVEVPVYSAAEADLALTRGAVLVAARTLDVSDPPASVRVVGSRRVALLSAVLAAAVVTFVVSVSVALGHTATRDALDRPEKLSVATRSDPVSAVPTAPRQAAAPPTVAFPDAPRVLAQTMIVKAVPVPVAEPVYAPAPAAPPPVYQAPAPVYAPPPAPPRLRDRIIDHIPIIGRFHQPGQ